MRNPKQQAKPSIEAQTKRVRKVTVRKNGTRRVTLDFKDSPSLTHQEYLRETNINNIVRMPLPEKPILSYGDLSDPPNLEQVFATVHTIKENFEKLPSDLRRLMNNDPAKLQEFIQNPDNTPLLIKKGVLIPTEDKSAPEAPSKPKEPVQTSIPGSTDQDTKNDVK